MGRIVTLAPAPNTLRASAVISPPISARASLALL